MPVETLYAEIDFSLSPSSKVHRMQRKANGDSGFSSRSRNSDSDDELLGYLSREEQECILFFDTTLDSLNDDVEDRSSITSVTSDHASTPTTVNSTSEEIIDLVSTRPPPGTFIPRYQNIFPVDQEGGRWRSEEDVHERFAVVEPQERSPPPMPALQNLPKQRSFEMPVDDPDVDVMRGFCGQAKPLGSVPTPMVIAQKIAEGRAENGVTHPVSPSETKPFPPPPQEKPRASLTSPVEARVFSFRNPKVQRLPSNISISASSKDYNNTITMAAVKVKERKAQVLANLGGAGLLAVESEEKQLRGPVSSPRRTFSLVHPAKTPPLVKQFSDETDNRLSNGLRSPVGMAGPAQTPKVHPVAQTAPQSPPPATAAGTKPAPRVPPPPNASAGVQRSRSFQKPSAFRPQGITVQFSGRGSTDESRKEALRKLGLLRINEDQ